VVQKKGQGVVDRPCIDGVVVVEDEYEIVRDGCDLVEQGRQNRFGRRRLGGPEHTRHPFPDIRHDRLQGGDEVSEKARGVVVPLVQRQPGDGSIGTGGPFAEKRGLAEAGWGGDEGQPAVDALFQTLDQTRSKNHPGPGRGDVELGG
jgi:hypothetical protein